MFENAADSSSDVAMNKMNLRIEILNEFLLSLGEGCSAKANALRQTIRRNKTDMAEDACRSLDLMRQVFQAEMTNELQQILERHLRTTFMPALENLRKNGIEVSHEDIKFLCRSILEDAKKPFMPELQAKADVDKNGETSSFRNSAESDIESEASLTIEYAKIEVPRMRKRGRPPKIASDRNNASSSNGKVRTTLNPTQWNPQRLCATTRFVLAKKVARFLMLRTHRRLFLKYPSIFRYNADETDRNWLIENRFIVQITEKMYLLVLDDAMEIAAAENKPNLAAELERNSFCIPASMILKMKQEMRKVFESAK